MYLKTALICLSTCTLSQAAVRSGKAQVDWLAASTTCEAGKPLQTAFRMVLDEGWHTYWTNPGEGGMKISIDWEMPPGWTAGDLEYPAPMRFMTGELPGFGYEGTVVIPIVLNPPENFSGEAKLKGKFSWLTCNDDSCIPGNAELELNLNAGPQVATDDAKVIQDAYLKVPKPQDSWLHLGVVVKEHTVALRIEPHPGKSFAANDYEVFPATGEIIDPVAKPLFVKVGDGWESEVSKSEYATDPVKALTLVLVEKNDQPPISLTWKSE